MIILRRRPIDQEGWYTPYRDRPECQLLQLAFLHFAGPIPEGFSTGDIQWYIRSALDFCFTQEHYRQLINPLLLNWDERGEKIEELLSNPNLKEQFATYCKTCCGKTFLFAIKGLWGEEEKPDRSFVKLLQRVQRIAFL